MKISPTYRQRFGRPRQRNIREGLELVNFSEEVREHGFNVAAMQHVLPAWISRLQGGASNDFIRVFNEKVGPLVGLTIESNGTVRKVP